jgi:hypothetical protein
LDVPRVLLDVPRVLLDVPRVLLDVPRVLLGVLQELSGVKLGVPTCLYWYVILICNMIDNSNSRNLHQCESRQPCCHIISRHPSRGILFCLRNSWMMEAKVWLRLAGFIRPYFYCLRYFPVSYMSNQDENSAQSWIKWCEFAFICDNDMNDTIICQNKIIGLFHKFTCNNDINGTFLRKNYILHSRFYVKVNRISPWTRMWWNWSTVHTIRSELSTGIVHRSLQAARSTRLKYNTVTYC